MHEENGILVVPSVPSTIASIAESVSDILAKLKKFPIDEIGRHAEASVAGINKLVNSGDAGRFVTRAKSNIDAHRVYSAPTDRSTGIICDQTISLDGFYTRQDYPELLRRIRFKDPESGKTLVFITNNFSLPAATICALYKSRWQVELFFKWIKQHLRIKQFYGTSENAVKTQIWIAVSVYVLVAIVKKRPGRLALHFVTDPLGDPLRENAHTSSTCGRRKQMQRFANNQPIEFIRFLTGH